MLVLSLVSCGYSYTKDDMSQYMTFDKADFDAALQQLEYEDGDFTTNEDTRKEKIANYIYNLLVGRVNTDSEKLTDGKISDLDKVYYRYYATFEKDGKTIVVYPSKMASASASDNVTLGKNDYTGKDKAIRDEIVKLIGEGKLDALKTFVYEPKTAATDKDHPENDTQAGVTAYISYTKTWKEGETSKTQTYSYERVVLGDANHFAATQLVGSTIGTSILDKVKVQGASGEEEKARVEVVDGVEYTYTSLKVNCVVPTVELGENVTGLNNEILVDYELPSKITLTKNDFVTELDSYEIASGTKLTYHVNVAYYNDVEELNADLVLKELLADLPYATVKDENGKDTAEARKLACLENAEDELKAFNEALADFNTKKSAYDDAVKAVEDAQAALDKVKKNNEEGSKAVKDAETALSDKKEEEEDALSSKNDAENAMNEKLKALYAKVNADEAQAKAAVVADFEKLVREVLLEQYNDEVKTNIAKAVWTAMKASANVTDHPKKAVEDAYDRMYEIYQTEFYTEKGSNGSHYSEHDGKFESFLIQEMKAHKDVPDAANSVTDYTQAKHALWYLAEQYVADIVIIYYVADLYELTYSDSEIKDFKNSDDRNFKFNKQYQGANNVLAAFQFDGVMDHFLEIEKDADGNEIYNEDGTPKYAHIVKKS